MLEIKYKVYPTLLNAYQSYAVNPSPEAKIKLLNRINRVNDFDADTLQKFRKGSSFEDAVLKNSSHDFEQVKVFEMRNMLPQNYISQQLIKFNHKNIQFYGYADVVGEHKIIDIKTTSKYTASKFESNFQNLYLYGLKDMGFTEMSYFVYDFHKIYVETYLLETYDFEPLLKKMEDFALFLEEHKDQITDSKIFVKPQIGGLF